MSAMSEMKIKFQSGEYRPCVVKKRKALFHRWDERAQVYEPVSIGKVPGQIKLTLGIIEYEDGTVHQCYPEEIRFCDNKFQEFCFGKDDVK